MTAYMSRRELGKSLRCNRSRQIFADDRQPWRRRARRASVDHLPPRLRDLDMTVVESLLRLDTGAVSDALDRMGLPGAVAGIRPMTGRFRIAGRVTTVKIVLAEGRAAGRHLCTAAVEASGPGDVLVVEHRSRADCAGWGSLLSRAAKIRGIEGTIVDGAVRDVDETREMSYPLFGRAAVPLTARGRVIEEGWNVPVRIGDVEVRPGDLAIADGSGWRSSWSRWRRKSSSSPRRSRRRSAPCPGPSSGETR